MNPTEIPPGAKKKKTFVPHELLKTHKQPCDCAWCVSSRDKLRAEGAASLQKMAEHWQRVYRKDYEFTSIRFLESVIKDALTLAGNTAAQMADAGYTGQEIAIAILTTTTKGKP